MAGATPAPVRRRNWGRWIKTLFALGALGGAAYVGDRYNVLSKVGLGSHVENVEARQADSQETPVKDLGSKVEDVVAGAKVQSPVSFEGVIEGMIVRYDENVPCTYEGIAQTANVMKIDSKGFHYEFFDITDRTSLRRKNGAEPNLSNDRLEYVFVRDNEGREFPYSWNKNDEFSPEGRNIIDHVLGYSEYFNTIRGAIPEMKLKQYSENQNDDFLTQSEAVRNPPEKFIAEKTTTK